MQMNENGNPYDDDKEAASVTVRLNPLTFIVESLGGATLLERLQVRRHWPVCVHVPALARRS